MRGAFHFGASGLESASRGERDYVSRESRLAALPCAESPEMPQSKAGADSARSLPEEGELRYEARTGRKKSIWQPIKGLQN